MNASISLWLFFRGLRWAAWIFFLGFSFYFWLDRTPWLNSFGHLQTFTEMLMFGPAAVAVFMGFIELMMRDRAGLAQPKFGQLIPAPAIRGAISERP